MKVQDIKQYKNNAKQHPDDQVRAIAVSIKNFGWRQPIVLGKNNVIVVGHGRYLAYIYYKDQFKLKEIWAVNEKGETVLGECDKRKLSPEEEIALRLTDNQMNKKTGSDQSLIDGDVEILKEAKYDISILGFDQDLLDDQKEIGTEVPLEDNDPDNKTKIVLAYSSKDYLEVLELLGKFKEQYEHETNEEAVISMLRQMT